MSRYYYMTVEITGVVAGRLDAVEEAAGGEWRFSHWTRTPHTRGTGATGESHLVGGETDDAFARRLARAIWGANGAYCSVSVAATYLEELPCETYCPGEDDYAAFLVEQLEAH